jgi:hypothetical protein
MPQFFFLQSTVMAKEGDIAMMKFRNQYPSSFKLVFLFWVVFGVLGLAHVTEVHAAVACSDAIPNSCTTSFGLPGCYTCSKPSGGLADCVPDNTLCDSLNTNQCRGDSCLPNATPFVTIDANPTGCDYELIPTSPTNECKLCSAPQPPGFTACGNGICEPGLGETFANCSVDCRVPGFVGPKLPTGDPVLDGACPNPAPPPAKIDFVTFAGPTFNVPDNAFCEDGDVCSKNTCNINTGNCDVVDPAPCDPVQADFCCPVGCHPPTGTSCSPNDLTCDPDCLPPVECPFCGNNIIDAGEQCDGTAANNCGLAGCNDTTCQCNPPIIHPGCLEGDGVFGKESSPGSCDGFSCSLHKDTGMPPAANLLLLVVVLGGLGVGIYLRKRED